MYQLSKPFSPIALLALLGLGLPTAGCSTEPPPEVEIVSSPGDEVRGVPLVGGLAHPWGMAFLPDGRILVTERPGRLRMVENGQLLPDEISGLPLTILASGQGGLLDVAIHPDFTENGLVYISYAGSGSGGIGTEVARGRLDGMTLRDTEVIFQALPKSGGGRHFGSRLLFSPDGHLFVSLGDRGHRPNGQDRGTHAGSLIRLLPDGGEGTSGSRRRLPCCRPTSS